MSHDIADCPDCGKRTFVLKDNGEWECLNPKCGRTHPMLKTELEKQETKVDAMTVLVAGLIVTLFIMFAIVGV